METPRDNHEAALRYAALGYRCIPLLPGSKSPAVRWKRYQAEDPTAADYRRWFRGTRNNIALVCGDLVVVDVDSPDMVDFVLAHCGRTPSISRTPRGGYHLPYRARPDVPLTNRVKVRGLDVDLRVAGGYSVEAGSVGPDGGPYAWVEELRPLAELPVVEVGWLQDRTRARARAAVEPGPFPPAGVGRIRYPEEYCLRIESVQGRNGSRGLVRAVCVMRDAGRTRQQTFDFIMGVWNPACARPEWSEGEVSYAIARHYGPQ